MDSSIALTIISTFIFLCIWLVKRRVVITNGFSMRRHARVLKVQSIPDGRGNLDEIERSRLELKQYLEASHDSFEVGRMYERYIGYIYEQKGYDVEFHGAVRKFSDLGRDLIVKKENEILVVQTKYWKKRRLISEKHIFQIYGSTKHFEINARYSERMVQPIIYATCKFSSGAREAAEQLGVQLYYEEFLKSYPMVKCNISPGGHKVYHLPTDPYYDMIRIKPQLGEVYVHTAEEAAAKGFRRTRKRQKAG